MSNEHPITPPPEPGEVQELVELMRYEAGCYDPQTDIRHGMLTRAAELLSQRHPPLVAIPGEEYHEGMGSVTWWRLPVEEPPWVGTPNDSDWPGYHTHFTPAPPEPLNARAHNALTQPNGLPGGGRHMEPPQIVTFQCEHYIPPATNSIHGSTNDYHS